MFFKHRSNSEAGRTLGGGESGVPAARLQSSRGPMGPAPARPAPTHAREAFSNSESSFNREREHSGPHKIQNNA